VTTVFVYGSLKRGFYNHSLLNGQKFIGPGKTVLPDFTMFNVGAFPGVVQMGNDFIYGELYDIDGDALEGLDYLEGHPNFYCREVVQVKDDEGHKHDAWMYFLPMDYVRGSSVVEGGQWNL
jgi:gamma-glutamylaminecyclotransferase